MYFVCLRVDIQKSQLYKTCLNVFILDRDIPSFDFLGEGLGIVLPIFQEKCFSCHILLADQISLSDCFTS